MQYATYADGLLSTPATTPTKSETVAIPAATIPITTPIVTPTPTTQVAATAPVIPASVMVQQSPANPEIKNITIPSFTNIPIIFKYPLAGNSLKNGDPIGVQVNDDVYVNNTLIFKKGQDATLFVDKSKHAGAWGRGGKIEIQTGSVRDAYGNDYIINATKHVGADSKPSAIILPIVSLVICWPLVFLAFRHGDEATITPGTIITGLTSSSKTIAVK
jgi:hypothetical protein